MRKTYSVEGIEALAASTGSRRPTDFGKFSLFAIEDLTAHKTAALRVELANNPEVALVAVVHALLLRVAYPYSSEQSALQLSLTHDRLGHR
ncbi:hypothetical protein [Sinorhizobium meliloti]|uniref:hypothetical protein n=1 Tax=Rhizobium meliloti TaxID=382 RepID=UPI0018659E61|nr:hypothetical protein [Sinorhizobium meliloti]